MYIIDQITVVTKYLGFFKSVILKNKPRTVTVVDKIICKIYPRP